MDPCTLSQMTFWVANAFSNDSGQVLHSTIDSVFCTALHCNRSLYSNIFSLDLNFLLVIPKRQC